MAGTSNNINKVIFDLGGVLIGWDPMRVYRQIFDREEEVIWCLENVCTYDWNFQQDAGRLLAEAIGTVKE